MLTKGIVILCSFFVFASPAFGSEKLRITTWNLKWYGIGGAMWNEPELEFRQENIKRFFKEELNDTDIAVFTEVVKTDSLEKTFKDRFECVSYQGAWSQHQHIVTCFNPRKYRAEKFDSDYIIEEVDLGSGGLRPATQVKICRRNSKKCFLQVIGVHLMAGRESEGRYEQMQFIDDALLKNGANIPTVVTGDFNSYITEQSGLPKNDIDKFEEILNNPWQSFHSITKDIKTYGSGERGRTYDHIMISDDIRYSNVKGYKACEKNIPLTDRFIPYISFRKYYSDHCPVSATLTIKD